MSIVSSAEIIAYTGASSYDVVTQAIHEGIEQIIKNECDKAFEATTYLNEFYDGLGTCRMRLRHVPITTVSREGFARGMYWHQEYAYRRNNGIRSG